MFNRLYLLVASLVVGGLYLGCSSTARTGAPGERSNVGTAPVVAYEDLAATYSLAQHLLGEQGCAAASDTLRDLVAADSDLRFPLSYSLLEGCITELDRHAEARQLLRDGRHRAVNHPDSTTRALAYVFEEWSQRYEVYLESGQRVRPRPDVPPTIDGGLEGLISRLVYPDTAQSAPFEGTVRVQARVDENGSVLHAFIQGTSGSLVYDLAALDAVKQARFVAGRLGDRAIRTWVSVPVEF
jgi:TonB family protein